jgi:hypothetical protein
MISKEMSSWYFRLGFFCKLKARIRKLYVVFKCTHVSLKMRFLVTYIPAVKGVLYTGTPAEDEDENVLAIN